MTFDDTMIKPGADAPKWLPTLYQKIKIELLKYDIKMPAKPVPRS